MAHETLLAGISLGSIKNFRRRAKKFPNEIYHSRALFHGFRGCKKKKGRRGKGTLTAGLINIISHIFGENVTKTQRVKKSERERVQGLE
jgi:hypothetical protein